MSHYQAVKFIELTDAYFEITQRQDCSILEVGSYDVNGTVRNILKSDNYVGIDLAEGPGVDKVVGGQDCDFDSEIFDLCIASEVFEHNPYWKETFENMYRMTKNHGFVLITCGSTGRPEHGTARTDPSHAPGAQAIGWDYYHNLSVREFEKILREYQFGQHVLLYNKVSKDLYFMGIKGRIDAEGQSSVKSFLNTLNPVFERDNQESQVRFGFKTLLLNIIELPVELVANLFPDKYFQNFQIAYKKLISFLWLKIK
ncbi:class I SAM-dependent methyltransferase [Porticoccaceae bacterium]|nr:class I SAM-dependent methyltransferase [Porticoccaceae bacterium]